MSYTFLPNCRYRMPTHFGPSLGPRQGPEGRTYAGPGYAKGTLVSAIFEADESQLEKFMPPGFKIRHPHCVKLEFCYSTDVAWLAGRGYNTFGVSVYTTYEGERDTIDGELLLILWENKADPIITGREDVGFSKLYCELPAPQFIGDKVTCRASWDAFQFATLELSGLTEASFEDLPQWPPSQGLLHYKYIPKTSAPGESDAQYAIFTPGNDPYVVMDKAFVAKTANRQFQHATWEQLPTLVHIVNALADLSLGNCVYATLIHGHGGNDLSNQQILV